MGRSKKDKVRHVLYRHVQELRWFVFSAAYVALSRCTSLEGLEVHNFSPATVIAHTK